jgi:hypothetical protein
MHLAVQRSGYRHPRPQVLWGSDRIAFPWH